MTLQDLVTLIPILLLSLGGTALLMVGAWWDRPRPLWLIGVALAAAAAAHAVFVTPDAPLVAGMFRFDLYGRFFTVLWSLAAALTLLFSLRYGQERRFGGGEYVSLVLFGAAGMSLLSASMSLVGFFLGLESFTLVLYILIAFHSSSEQGGEAGLKYLVMGAVATGFVAFGIALIYAASGTFVMEEAMAALVTEDSSLRILGLLGWLMLLVAVGFKVSLAPFHLWTPDVYQGAPAPVSGLLSTGSKGAVLSALFPLVLLLGEGGEGILPVLWGMCLLSMLVGTFCALRQENLKRIVAYSSVVHMGYAVLALLAGGEYGGAALVFYLVVYTLANLGIFGLLGALSQSDRELQTLEDLAGLGRRRPWSAAALSICLLSLAGIPPTAGFIGKFGIFYAAIRADLFVLALVGILTSLISLYFYLLPIVRMFMGEKDEASHRNLPRLEGLALGACCFGLLLLGVLPGFLLDIIRRLF